MYLLVYLHKTVRTAALMLVKVFCRASEISRKGENLPYVSDVLSGVVAGQELTATQLIDLDDHSIWVQLKLWANHSDPVLSLLSSRLLNRKYFKAFPVTKRTFELLQKLDSSSGHLAALVQARKSISSDAAKFFYGFDAAEFNIVGKEREGNADSVWILREGAGAHQLITLHDYWRSRKEDLDVARHYFMIDSDCVDDASVIVERLRHAENMGYDEGNISAPPGYEILATLGREGVWKSVYLGATSNPGDHDEGSIVALKCYKSSSEVDEAIHRDVRQVNILLSDVEGAEYLSKARFLGQVGDRAWLSEKMWSSSLYDLVINVGPIHDLKQALHIGRDLARGLAALHRQGLRHTDIKPENCGVVRRGGTIFRYLLGDFGCISLTPNSRPNDPRLFGTQRTRAPEVFTNDAFSLAADVWAIGATIYSLCCKRYPFMNFDDAHGNEDERASRVREIARHMDILWPRFLAEIQENLPPVLYELLQGCFAPAEERCSAQTLAESFERKLTSLKTEGPVSERHAWQRAEDLLSQKQIVSGIETSSELSLLRDVSEFIPPRLLQRLEQKI